MIDVCPVNSSLLAYGGADMGINLYDRRESKIVKTIASKHSGNIVSIIILSLNV